MEQLEQKQYSETKLKKTSLRYKNLNKPSQ